MKGPSISEVKSHRKTRQRGNFTRTCHSSHTFYLIRTYTASWVCHSSHTFYIIKTYIASWVCHSSQTFYIIRTYTASWVCHSSHTFYLIRTYRASWVCHSSHTFYIIRTYTLHSIQRQKAFGEISMPATLSQITRDISRYRCCVVGRGGGRD